MGTVRQPRGGAEGTTFGAAVAAFLATLDHPESKGTHRAYGTACRVLTAAIGQETDLSGLSRESLSAAFRQCWGDAKPGTWNARRGALGSLLSYCEAQGWLNDAKGLIAGIETRKAAPDQSRALTRGQIDRILASPDLSLRDRTLFRMLYETAARSAEVLNLNVEDLDRPNKRAVVVRKGGVKEYIIWDTATARLLPRLLSGRENGPVFVTERKGKGHADGRILAADLTSDGYARLSYRMAEEIFKEVSGGATLHQLRHSALTHAAEDGVNTPMLQKMSGHRSVRTLGKYARPSDEAYQRFREERERARRR